MVRNLKINFAKEQRYRRGNVRRYNSIYCVWPVDTLDFLYVKSNTKRLHSFDFPIIPNHLCLLFATKEEKISLSISGQNLDKYT